MFQNVQVVRSRREKVPFFMMRKEKTQPIL